MDLNLIIGLVLVAILGLFVLFGLLKGFLRSLIGIVFSTVSALVVAVLLAFFAQNILDKLEIDFNAITLIGDFLQNDLPEKLVSLNLYGLLMDPVLGEFAIVDFIVLAVYSIAIYLVLLVVFYLIRKTLLRVVRTVKSKTVDLVFGAAIWGAFGAVIVVGIVILVSQIYIFDISFGEFVLNDKLAVGDVSLGDLFADDADGLFSKIWQFLVDLDIDFLTDLLVA